MSKIKVEPIDEREVPKIFIRRKALTWIEQLVDQHHTEVGFYGVVEQDENSYTIEDIFYPKHDLVTAGTCEISAEGMMDISDYLADNDRIDEVGKLRMWGHSHVNMGVSPSGQDEENGLMHTNDVKEFGGEYFIRLITNKKGLMGITFYDIPAKLKYTDLPLNLKYDEDNVEEVLDMVVGTSTDSGLTPLGKITEIEDAVNSWKMGLFDLDVITKEVTALKAINIPVGIKGGGFSSGYNTPNKGKTNKAYNNSTPNDKHLMEQFQQFSAAEELRQQDASADELEESGVDVPWWDMPEFETQEEYDVWAYNQGFFASQENQIGELDG